MKTKFNVQAFNRIDECRNQVLREVKETLKGIDVLFKSALKLQDNIMDISGESDDLSAKNSSYKKLSCEVDGLYEVIMNMANEIASAQIAIQDVQDKISVVCDLMKQIPKIREKIAKEEEKLK